MIRCRGLRKFLLGMAGRPFRYQMLSLLQQTGLFIPDLAWLKSLLNSSSPRIFAPVGTSFRPPIRTLTAITPGRKPQSKVRTQSYHAVCMLTFDKKVYGFFSYYISFPWFRKSEYLPNHTAGFHFPLALLKLTHRKGAMLLGIDNEFLTSALSIFNFKRSREEYFMGMGHLILFPKPSFHGWMWFIKNMKRIHLQIFFTWRT